MVSVRGEQAGLRAAPGGEEVAAVAGRDWSVGRSAGVVGWWTGMVVWYGCLFGWLLLSVPTLVSTPPKPRQTLCWPLNPVQVIYR